jgi:AcrR family transcriptional regulator
MRAAIRQELTEAAAESFAELGADGTTVTSIAARVGVSERTFYRYFPTKEDAILQPVEAIGSSIAEALRQRSPVDSPFEALREAFKVAVETVHSDPAKMMTVMELNRSDPTLRMRHLRQADHWVDLLVEAQLARDPSQSHVPTRTHCAVMMLVWEQALTTCFSDGDLTRIAAEFDSALDRLREFL